MGDWLHSFIFAAWDNVVGPKVLKTWPTTIFTSTGGGSDALYDGVDEIGVEIEEEKGIDTTDEPSSIKTKNSFMKANEDLIAKYISIHTLTGHLAKTKHTDYDGINEISLTVPALGFASQTATFYCLCFSSNENETNNFCIDEPNMASLSLVFEYGKCLDAFWNLQPLIVHLLSKTAERLKVGLSQDLNYHNEPIVLRWLAEIHQIVMDSCRLRIRTKISSPISIKQTMKTSQIPWDVVITSMLTTMGSCCVVGKNGNQINKIIDVLAVFLPETHQFSCSRYAAKQFSGGLFIQGLLENTNGVRNMNSADIMLNEFPLTVLDLSQKGKVKYSGNVHEHYLSKQRHSREQEFNIVQRRQPNLPFTTESVFRPFGESSRYIRWCLEQLATHNTEKWSRIISAFHQALALQAHDVIKAFQSRSFSNGDSIKLAKSHLKKSMKVTESDFWLLVSTAERLKPGFCRIFANYRL